MARVRRGEETSLETYDEAISLIVAMELAQIRLLEEFGPSYFELAQITRISAAVFRAMAPAVSPESGAEDLGESWVAWLMARISLDEASALIQSPATNRKTILP